MNKIFATVLLCALLSACKPDAAAPEAPAAAPAATAATPATPHAGAAASAASAEMQAQAEAVAKSVAEMAANGPPLTEGVDYVAIPNGQPFDPLDGKTEVVEAFGYVCPACAQFQPLVSAWKRSLPANVRFTYLPAPFGGAFLLYARAFYAAQALGVQEQSHDAIYRAIHIDQTLKGERGKDTPEEIAAFYANYGADPKTFVETMNSFAIEGKLSRAKQFMQRSGVDSTPTLVVNGKYRVMGKTREDQLRIVQQLIAREQAGQ